VAFVSYGCTSETPPADGKTKPVATWLLGFSVAIVSYFRYGPRLTTHNNTTMLATGTPLHAIYHFPDIKDAGRLYRLHKALAARSGLHDKVFRLDDEFHGDAAATVAAFILDGYTDDVELGYLYPSPAEKLYRPTWKGAFLMKWKSMWPMQAIRWAAADRKARRLQAELEGQPPQVGEGEYAKRGFPSLAALLVKLMLLLGVGGYFVGMLAAMQRGGLRSWLTMLVAVLGGVVLGVMLLALTRRAPRRSAEKEAAGWRVNESEGRAVDALFASLQAAGPGPAAERRRQSTWDRARPVAVAPGERLRVRLRAPDTNWGRILRWLLPALGLYSLLGFALAASMASSFLGRSAGLAAGGIAVLGTDAGIVYLFLRTARRLSRVAVEVCNHRLQAGKSHAVEIWHADPRTLRDVRLRLVSVERSGQNRSARTKTSCCPPVLLTSPAESGSGWKGRLEVPGTAVSFGLDRFANYLNVDEDLEEQVKWHLELRPRPWSPWVVRYPVEIRGPAGGSRGGTAPQPDAAQLSTRLQAEDLVLWIDGGQAVLAPGAILTGGFEPHEQDGHSRLRRVEFSVVFVTRSKARRKETSDVCHFEEYEATDDNDAALRSPRRFRAILPEGPPSFAGQVFHVSWAVRVRLFYRDGKESVRDLPFLLLPGGGEQIVGDTAAVAASPG
jgi:hypothetical protein